MINIYTAEKTIEKCTCAIVVPEKALTDAGYIKTITVENDAASKHEFHAMSQMVYYQFQDGEVGIDEVEGIVKIELGVDIEVLESGMVLYRDNSGGFNVLVHSGLNTKKLIEVAYRFCTRWVRLDI